MKRVTPPASPGGRSGKTSGGGKAQKVGSPPRGSAVRGSGGRGRGTGAGAAGVAAASGRGGSGGGGAAADTAGGGGGRAVPSMPLLPTAQELLKQIAEYQAHLVTLASRNHQGVQGRWNGPDTTRRFAIEQMVIPRLSAGILPDKNTPFALLQNTAG